MHSKCHPDWAPGLEILVDCSKSDLSGLSAADVRNASEAVVVLGEQFGTGRAAMVVGRDVDFGMVRMWELLTADKVPFEFCVFRNLAEACEWLEVVPRS